MDWIDQLLAQSERATRRILFDSHAIMRQGSRNIEPRQMELAVRRGRVLKHKCGYPRKLCLEYYDGKTNMTYGVYVLVREYDLKVLTGWKTRGRK